MRAHFRLLFEYLGYFILFVEVVLDEFGFAAHCLFGGYFNYKINKLLGILYGIYLFLNNDVITMSIIIMP